jgi:hypothetical protein
MLKIQGDYSHFWQWDTGRRLIVDDTACSTVYFYNGTTEKALAVEVKEVNGVRSAAVPDLFLQTARPLTAYVVVLGANKIETRFALTFPVYDRAKPYGYVSTDDEILLWADLDERLRALEEGGVPADRIDEAVEEYLGAHPVQAGATAEQAAQIQANKEAIEQLRQQGGTGDSSGGNVDLSGYVKSVNGVTPDESGNINVASSTVTLRRDDSSNLPGVWIDVTTINDDGSETTQGELVRDGDRGLPGTAGGYYIPTVSQPTSTTLKVEHTPSDARMPAVEAVTITLPDGSGNNSSQTINPVAKTEDMTQPVGVDENGQLWTAPGCVAGGESEENTDALLGTLPMTISESNCYLLSETNATISTGDGAAQLIDMDANVPYIGDTTYNGGAFEIIGKNTVKISFANVAKNATAYVPTKMEAGKTYTLIAKLVEKSDDLVSTKMPIVRVFDATTGGQYQVVTTANGVMQYKTFTAPKDNTDVQVVLPAVSGTYVAGETYATVSVYLYEGEHVEIPTGATFDILAGEKYSTDGYIGATLSEVNGKTVQVYKTDTSGSESETDNGGVIFFGDSILHYSDVTSRYAAKTGKSVLNCAVGGTRMSASRDSANSYYPLDMANIADAIASGDFSAQLNSSVVTSAFTTLATATISNYKAIVLEFGTNDFSALVPFDGEGVETVKGALKHILTSILTKYPNMRVVVLSTLQYVTQGTGTATKVHEDGTVWEMNKVIRDVCESDEFCVPFVDMYHAFGQNSITRNTLNSDGVHLTSPNGAKRYADILTAKLNGLGI